MGSQERHIIIIPKILQEFIYSICLHKQKHIVWTDPDHTSYRDLVAPWTTNTRRKTSHTNCNATTNQNINKMFRIKTEEYWPKLTMWGSWFNFNRLLGATPTQAQPCASLGLIGDRPGGHCPGESSQCHLPAPALVYPEHHDLLVVPSLHGQQRSGGPLLQGFIREWQAGEVPVQDLVEGCQLVGVLQWAPHVPYHLAISLYLLMLLKHRSCEQELTQFYNQLEIECYAMDEEERNGCTSNLSSCFFSSKCIMHKLRAGWALIWSGLGKKWDMQNRRVRIQIIFVC